MKNQINSQDDIEKLSILLKSLHAIGLYEVFILPQIEGVIQVTDKHLTVQQMKEVTDNGKKLLKAEIAIPFNTFMEGYGEHDGIDILNDLISKTITGEEHALTNFNYHIRGTDEHKRLILYVEGSVEDYLNELEEEN